MTRSLPPQPVCGEEGERAADALSNQKLYDQLINIFSMRTFVPTTEESGHDHFFASFNHFQAAEDPRHLGEWVDELASRAASQNEQYLEIMEPPVFSDVAKISSSIDWPTGPADPALNRTGDATGRRKGGGTRRAEHQRSRVVWL